MAVGSNAEIERLAGAQTRRIDLRGRTVTPGLLDAHAHFSGGYAERLDLSYPSVKTIGELVAKVGAQGVSGGEGVERTDEARGRYISLQFSDDVLVGATAIGLTDHVGALRGLIQARTRLGPWKQRLLETPTRFVEAFIACQRPNS